tara:strand:- start:228 stop:446 length:219 start_codon:yes stop_codon:yes gene_type:complete
MRSAWFEHVRKTRKKLSKGKKEPVSHRVAMQQASSTWPKEKEKVLRAQKRVQRKKLKEAKSEEKPNVTESTK